MVLSPESVGGASAKREMTRSLAQKCYEVLRKRIITCELAPGTVVSEKELVDLLRVSRTPVREALSRLQQERLVEVLPKRGIFISTLSVQDVIDLFAVREVVEPFAARLATPNIPATTIEELRTSYVNALEHPAEIEEHVQGDRYFHLLVAEYARNSYLRDIITTIYDQNSRIRFISLKRDRERELEAIKEHLALLDEIIKGSPQGAERAMRRHIACARAAALKALMG